MARSIFSRLRLCRAVCCAAFPSARVSVGLASVRPSSTVILGQSTVILQDGLRIQELPWVIRRLDPREFPFNRVTYSADDIRNHAEQDEAFEQLLQDCKNVRQVFRLLEVPGEQVTVFSAVFALRRIYQLKTGTSDDIDSFIRKAILNELCETVVREIGHLSNRALIDTARCSVTFRSHDDHFVEKVKEEIERRIGDGIFAIGDICLLISIFSEHVRGDPNTTRNLWIHLGSRYKEFGEENIASVYRMMRNITPEFRYLWQILDKQLQTCWWKLNASDVGTVARQLVLANYQSSQTLSAFGKWLFAHIHEVKDVELKDIVALYTHFNFSDANVVSSLERYATAKIGTLDKTIAAMLMDYCCQKRFLSTLIFDAVAQDFQKSSTAYRPLEVTFALRAFGILNYLPPNASEFFAVAENSVHDICADLDPVLLLELLSSFVYLEHFPVNFVRNVFTPHFFAKINAISDATRRQKAVMKLLQLQASIFLDFPSNNVAFLANKETFKISLTWLEGRSYKFHHEVKSLLRDLVGASFIREMVVAENSPHLINFEISLDRNRNLVQVHEEDKEKQIKLALVGMMPEFYCINTHHLLGEFATKKRHLEKLGYVFIQMEYEKFMWHCRGTVAKAKYLKSILSPHLNFNSKLYQSFD